MSRYKRIFNYQTRLAVWMFPLFVLILTLACSAPALLRRATPTSTAPIAPSATLPVASPTPLVLPPAIVETDPLPNAELGLTAPIAFYFNQPMQRDSVETALKSRLKVAGSLQWKDDSTLVFTPEEPYQPESEISFEFGDSARSRQGLALPIPVSYTFRTVGYLRLTQSLPEAEATDVNPTSAVVAAFNYPVVPLGADPASLPPAFSLDPAAAGRGEWINTSTFIFYPEPALEGGRSYQVRLNPELRGLEGSPLQDVEGWSFTTAPPRLVSVEPAGEGKPIRLDREIVLAFNQPMDAASVERSFSLVGADGETVPGEFQWDEKRTTLTFSPASLLKHSTTYILRLDGSAQALGGTPLGSFTEIILNTVAPLAVVGANPVEGSVKGYYDGVYLYLNGPAGVQDVKPYLSVTPAVTNLSVWYNEYDYSLSIFADFFPDTSYTVRLSAELPDPWGGNMGEDFVLNFRTGSIPAGLYLTNASEALFLTPQDASIRVQATNYYQVPMALGGAPLADFIAMTGSDNAYTIRQSYASPDQRTWRQNLSLTRNLTQEVDLYLTPDRQPLEPGLYYLRIATSQDQDNQTVTLLVVSNVHLLFKLSATEALVWAVDLRTNTPVADAPITILDRSGSPLASGRTDSQGVFHAPIAPIKDVYSTAYAVLGTPGEELFSLALSTWNTGTGPWDFGIATDFSGPTLKAYLYTDRPIYRPGQTVYFRGVVRQAYNGRYTLPEIASLPLKLYKNYNEEIASFELPLSEYGTVHGEYALPSDAQPGDYRLASPEDEFSIAVYFKVAEYRKPEIDVQVDLSPDQALAGETLVADVKARYFFDAPAGNVPLHWTLLEAPAPFSLPGYQVGLEDTRWLEAYYFGDFMFDNQVASGEALTDPEGKLRLELPTQALDERKRYTLEVTLTDEGGFPVSGRDSVEVNPAQYFIGVRPDAWVGRADEQTGFEVLVVDWERNPVGNRSLRADFQKVVWVREEPPPGDRRGMLPRFVPQYTPVGSVDFQTSAEGKARLSFTPPEPGTYQLDVTGDGARTQVLLWVGGPGQAVWPNLPNQRLRLTADRQEYQPGDTALVFVPNPYPANTPALVTIERGTILRHQVETIPSGGGSLSIPLSADDAPNVYVSVTLLSRNEQGRLDYRQGYLGLSVAPLEQILNVSLVSQPERAGPGEEVTLEIQVTDAFGQPVQGEFSLSLVDLAALALADPNAPDIVPAFYGNQPLGVRTGLPLGAYPFVESQAPVGGGGGGGEFSPPFVRERFPDTAYWNAEVLTDADGRARVTITLPDNLTTWQATARGVTVDTRVGQAEARLVATKELLIRPVTPRFAVVGDHIQLAAVVQNNTTETLQVSASLQASGVLLDDPASATRVVEVPANARSRLEWWGTVQDVESLNLLFAAAAGDLQDAVRPAGGRIPVHRYTAPQTFATSGILEEGGQRLELISLPRSYDPQGGKLKVELSSSLTGSMFGALEVLESYPYECTEQTISRFLPNLELYRVLQQYQVSSPVVQGRLGRTLQDGLDRLQLYQNQDGGWSWWQGGESDQHVSAYALFSLARARQAGALVSETAIQRAVGYLTATLTPAFSLAESWQLDRLAFVHFVLAQAGAGSPTEAESLYQMRDRLSPWAQALLALTLEGLTPGASSARTLLSDLQTSAIRSATGVHWQEPEPNYVNMGTPVSTTAMVVYALAQFDPSSPLLADAMRYLMTHRQADGAWGSTYSTAWTVMAAAEYLRASGELAGSFTYSAALNSAPIAGGQADSTGVPVVTEVPVAQLYPDLPNALNIQREAGSGRLYYTAALSVYRPVEQVAPLDQGVSIHREFTRSGDVCPQSEPCPPVQQAAAGELLKVRLILTLKNPAYYLLVEDYLPAGAEILNTALKTSQQAPEFEEQPRPLYEPDQPFANGWGWWLFSAPRIYDDHIAWSADYLPAGTYELTYYISLLQVGDYRVLPARAWQFYFPEVQGNSAGEIFSITP